MTPPVLTDEQRASARTSALHARRVRSDLRAGLRTGRITLSQVLDSQDSAYQRLLVRDLLRSLRGIGPIRSQRIMEDAGIAAAKRVGGLTARQRENLLRILAGRHERRR